MRGCPTSLASFFGFVVCDARFCSEKNELFKSRFVMKTDRTLCARVCFFLAAAKWNF